MLIIQVHIQVKAEHVEEFKAATILNATNSIQEPGIARFDFLQHENDPTRFELIEVYRDAEASLKHKETAHYLAWAEKVATWFASERTRSRFVSVFPADQDW
ncbi:MAG TPA: antibiotic biosynthesis monooxygenase [Bryobacteraceae bacterium]|nr:antibiotic biosynthesis monooxygenase [Bryobacteraceae bacterium]